MDEEYYRRETLRFGGLRAGRTINKIWIAENAQKQFGTDYRRSQEARDYCPIADKRKMDQMPEGLQHQGVVAQVAAYEYVEVEDILAKC